MTLPTGGQITYAWSPYTDSYGIHYQWINKRTTPDSSTGWTYTPQIVSTCGTGQVNCQQTFTVQKPNGDNTVYRFALNGGAWKNQVQTYTGAVSSANLLSTVGDCWNFVTITNGVCQYLTTPGSPATGVQKLAESTTLPVPGGTTITKTTQYIYDGYGNMTKIQENKYYTGNLPSTIDRTTTISYLNTTAYINALILNRPTNVTVTNSSSATVAQTLYSYDGSSLISGAVGACPAVTGSENHDDTKYGTGNLVRGNLTQVQRLISGTSNYLTTSMTYDITGQVRTSKDSNGNVTTYCYADNFFNDGGDGSSPTAYTPSKPSNAYLTTITFPTVNPVTLARSFGYYWGTGQTALLTDENSNTTSFHFYDSLNRPTATSLPNGGWTRTNYSSNDKIVDSYTGITSGPPAGNSMPTCTGTSGGCRWDESQLDGLGRGLNQILESDPDSATTVAAIIYDSDGRVATASNPYRSFLDPTYGLETPSYDGLDRTTQVKHADANIAYTYYGANVGTGGGATSQLCSSSTYGFGYPVLTVDEGGNKRQTWTDGFGRLIETDEPGSNGSLTVGTCNTYDLNNNLLQVTSLGLTQTLKPTYTYDMISRITSKSLPESGTSCFYYTTSGGTCGNPAAGTLCSGDATAGCRRTDARSITTTYAYDALNRLTFKSYSDGTPSVALYYDVPPTWMTDLTNVKGRLVDVEVHTGSTNTATVNSYDTVGNIIRQWQQTPPVYPFGDFMYYTYDLAGDITSVTYPGGRTVTYGIGNAQRPTSAMDTLNSINYVTSPNSPNVMYAPQGAPQNLIFGKTGSFNGITEIRAYNNRLETTGIEGTSSAGTPLNLAYSYVTGNNGNIATQTNNVSSGRSQSYSYDSLNRLLTAQAQSTSGGDCWGQSFGNNGPPPTLAADALANLFYTSSIKCSSPAPQYTMNTSNNNQFTGTGISYDADGDMTADTAYTYTYDAENRIITASGMSGGPYCYTYDGNGLRVMKAHASGGSCTGTVTVDMLYWRNIAGNTIAETDGSGSTTNSSYNEYIFFAGRRIAQSNPSSGSVYYYFVDHLGSTRVVTRATGTACYEVDYLPYGNENTPSGFSNTCSTRYRFTGYERDLETAAGTSSGNDYAFARYYNSRLGRFMSGDPLAGNIADPQTINKYTYVRNNPLNSTDPTGLSGCGEYNYWCFPDAWGAGNGGTVITVQDWCGDEWGPAYACFRALNPPRPPLSPSQVAAPAPKPQAQTFKQCMAANSSNFSIAGLAQGGINAALNAMGQSGVNFQNTWWAQLLGGNSISGTLFGSPGDAAMSAGTNTPGLLTLAMGTGTTYGRRTSTIMSLNLAGSGGLPQALGSASSGFRSLLGTADSVLSLGMSFTTRLEVDAAFMAAEAAYCVYETQ